MAEQWLVGTLTEADITAFATYQFPANQMEYYTIRKDFLKLDNPCEPCKYAQLEEPAPFNQQGDMFT